MSRVALAKHTAYLAQFCLPPQVYLRQTWPLITRRIHYNGMVKHSESVRKTSHERIPQHLGRNWYLVFPCKYSSLSKERDHGNVPTVSYLTVVRTLGAGRNVSIRCQLSTLRETSGSRLGAYGALIRLNAPVGTWLLFWPCVFSLGLALPVSESSRTSKFAEEANSLPATATLITKSIFYSDSQNSKEEEEDFLWYRIGKWRQTARDLWWRILGWRRLLAQPSNVSPATGPQDVGYTDDPQVFDIKGNDGGNNNADGNWLARTWCRAVSYILLCGVGAFLMRSVGCIINDMWDVSIDRKVSRTRNRPLASGALSRLRAGVGVAFLLTPAIGVLLQFNFYTVILGLSSLGLVVVYPAMKRIFAMPQLFLGLTFNWGALLGWAALLGPAAMPTFLRPNRKGSPFCLDEDVTTGCCKAVGPQCRISAEDSRRLGDHLLGQPSETQAVVRPLCDESAASQPFIKQPTSFLTTPMLRNTSLCDVSLAPLYLYVGAALWTFTYDTLYAHQDTVDDRRIGVRSSALLLGQRGTRVFGTVSTILQGLMWLQAGKCVNVQWPYYLGTLCCCLWITRLLWCTDLRCQASCKAAFQANQYIGAMFAASIFASKAVEWLRNTNF